ncbi:alpha/beta hydrolase [Mariluticola halotolerans]|uniref:alpha/beta hydrolase n=1 Tax=Mariluticola halotolerans TaxID=2909283 RepID=UPI0026E3A448|nr:alpha/beta hydrolase [Mariluticola halotolerans]UJQ94518.1 alpha/beta hydrolase [Mariluticola halotolerans]
MASTDAERIKAELIADKNTPELGLEESRKEWLENAANDPVPEGTKVEPVELAGVSAEWVQHPDSPGKGVFLFIHGGGYRAGGCITHRNLAARLSGASGTRVLVPDYRLAPEHPFPAALEDVSAVYGALLRNMMSPSQISIGGDSAGGGLAATLLLALRDAKGPLPSSAVFLSPWTDLTLSGESYETRREFDPSITREGLQEAAAQYAGTADPAHPLLSPIKADLTDFPPMLVHVGDHEAMLDDSLVFAERAKQAGVETEIEVWPDMWHVWHQWAPDLPEAEEAIEKIGVFIKAHFS